MKVFICPSTTNGGQLDAGPVSGIGIQASVAHYTINNGINQRLYTAPLNLLPPPTGYVPGVDSTQNVGALLLMSSISSFTTGMNPPFYNQRPNQTLIGISDGSSNTILWTEDAGCPIRYVKRSVASGRSSGAGWADPDNEIWVDGFTTYGLTTGGPCVMNCNNNNEIFSFHTRGCNFLMGDRRVVFAKDTMSSVIATILTTGVGGEVTPADW